ncbi:MAG: acyl-CoA synthetase, partial [Sphingobacteriales bacterium]
EAPMAVTLLKKVDHNPDDLLRLSSCGKALPWNSVALLDEDGRSVPDGLPGELCVRGPLVMRGYRNDPELSARTLEGGWLHTGDIAVRDSDGFLRIVDRKKDMIVSGGFNIYPREIEDILSAHPAVAEVSVFGVPHEKWGEAVAAAVVCKTGVAVDQQELNNMVADRKGSFQAPKRIIFMDYIPATPVGKPDKNALRALLS